MSSSPTAFVTDYAAAFNAAVGSGDYAPLLARFTDHAVLRFENVRPRPPLEFAGDRPSRTRTRRTRLTTRST